MVTLGETTYSKITVVLTLSNMRSINSVKLKVLLGIGDSIIISVYTYGAIPGEFYNRRTFILKQRSCTAKHLYVPWNTKKHTTHQVTENYQKISETILKERKYSLWKIGTFGRQQVIEQFFLLIDKWRDPCLSLQDSLICGGLSR